MTSTSSPIDPAGHKLLVTNTLTDTAGRKLVLTFIQESQAHHRLVFEVQSLQYNDGMVIAPPENRIADSWNSDAGGTVTSLEQHLELGRGARKTEITARYHNANKQTVIDVVLPTRPTKFTVPGMVTLRVGTISGHLSFSDGIRTWSQ